VEIRVGRGTDAEELARHVATMGEVEYAFVPRIRHPFGRHGTGPDPLASRQWAHGAIRIHYARAAPGFDDASGITVAIVDSGIDKNHPDLEAAISEYRNFLEEGDHDYIGHGTHVAGIVGAGFHNKVGIAGVCAARILALKALPHNDADWSAKAYYQALRYVIGRAQVLNLSLGGEKDLAEIDVLRDVIDAGVVVVAAMGNEYEEGNPVEYPAAMPEVCAVGATDQLDHRAGFSNTGGHIDLVAPGVQILSTTPTYRYDEADRNYAAWDGTSMASPHVAAAAALVLAKHPGSTPAQVVARLTSSADRVAGQKKRDRSYGAGRLNCEAALA
jgi:subtilisin family serine protease